MQQKNILLMMMLWFSFYLGWMALTNHFWPPPKKKPVERVLSLPDAVVWRGVPLQAQALMEQLPGVPGVGNACRVATLIALADWAGDKLEVKNPEPAKPRKPVETPKNIERVEIGVGEAFHLQVVLTSLGGAVESIVLSQFNRANYLGRPVYDALGQPEPLQLFPDPEQDPRIRKHLGRGPSYRLYHYAETKEAHPEHPLETLGKMNWRLGEIHKAPDDEVHRVAFVADVPGQDVTITKTYTLKRHDYHLGLSLSFESKRADPKPFAFRYQLAGAHALPIEGEWYTYTFRNAVIGQADRKGNIWRDLQDSRTIGVQDGGTEVSKEEDKYIGYAGTLTQYFASMIVVDNQQADGIKPDFLAWARPTVEGPLDPLKPQLDDITTRVISEPIVLLPGKPVEHRFLLYNGPAKVRLLSQIDNEQGADLVHRYEDVLHLDTLTDYHSPGAMGKFASAIGWSRLLILCTNMMHGLFHLLHMIVPNYGICIIMLTVIVRGSMYPLSRRQAIASAKMQEKMAELAPDVKKLEEKFKDDPMELQKAKQDLFLKRGVNPLAMMGSCWIAFLQMPIFMGLYYSLQESILLRLAPFLWITNLAAPDMLIDWGQRFAIINNNLGPFFNILPICAVILSLVYQKMVLPPATDDQTAMNQKMMKYMMIFMGFMFYKMAAGMCMYFIASSLWGLAERKLLPKRQAASPNAEIIDAAPSKRSRNGKQPAARSRGRDNEPEEEGMMGKVRDWWSELLKQASKK